MKIGKFYILGTPPSETFLGRMHDEATRYYIALDQIRDIVRMADESPQRTRILLIIDRAINQDRHR